MLDINLVLQHLGYEGKKAGVYVKYHCPFHQDNKPSLVTGGRGFPKDKAYCFSCNRAYSPIDLLTETGRCPTENEAIDLIKETWGVDYGKRKNRPHRESFAEKTFKLCKTVHQYLLDDFERIVQAWETEKKYPLTKKMVTFFQLGYMPPAKATVIEETFPFVKNKRATSKLLGRILFPVYTLNGTLQGFWGRVLFHEEVKGRHSSVKNLYIPLQDNTNVPPLGLARYKDGKPLVVVEGPSDCMVGACEMPEFNFLAAGGNVTRITPKLLEENGLDIPDNIIFCPDADLGGEMTFLTKLPELLKAWQDKKVHVLQLPYKTDLDEFIMLKDGARKIMDKSTKIIIPVKEWVKGVQNSQNTDGESLVLSEKAKKALTKLENGNNNGEIDFKKVLRKANDIIDPVERNAYLNMVASAQGLKPKELINKLKQTLRESFTEITEEEMTRFIHPSISADTDLATIGLRTKEYFLGQKEEFNFYIISDGEKRDLIKNDVWFYEKDGYKIRYAIESQVELPELDERIGRKNLQILLKNKTAQNSYEIYSTIKNLFKKYIFFELEEYYRIAAAYVIMTYFHRIYPAIPFLFLYGNKECGKTRAVLLLQRLCFNSHLITRSSEAVIGDILDGFRGTLIIDQAEFLALPQFESFVNFLAGSYTQDTANRAIVQMEGPKKRRVRRFDCFGPKIFASTREPHFDLRDRLILLPFVKTLKKYPAPTPTTEDWQKIRTMLYDLFLQQFKGMQNILGRSDTVGGRSGEIIQPLVTIWQLCNVPDTHIFKTVERIRTDIKEAIPLLYNFDQGILETLLQYISEGIPERQNNCFVIYLSSFTDYFNDKKGMKVSQKTISEIIRKNKAYLNLGKASHGEQSFMVTQGILTHRLSMLTGEAI